METTAIDTIQRTSTIAFPGLFGDWTIDPPAYFTLFGRPIYFYGVIVALGFILGISYCARHAGRFGIRAERAVRYAPDSAGTALNFSVVSDTVAHFRASRQIDENWAAPIAADYRKRGK